MATATRAAPVWKAPLWAGLVLSILPVLFLIVDAVLKFVKPPVVVQKTTELGYAESTIVPIAAVLLISTLLYLWPRTAVLGAILLTGYLGGAVATHVRAGSTPFETLFPAIFGVLLWSGLVLRDERLRSLVLWRG